MIKGFVDGYRPPSLITGWVDADAEESLIVRLVVDNEVISETAVGNFRVDLAHLKNGRVGFSLQTPSHFNIVDILREKSHFYVIGCESEIVFGEILIFKDLEGQLKKFCALSLIGDEDQLIQILRKFGRRDYPRLSRSALTPGFDGASNSIAVPRDPALLVPLNFVLGVQSRDSRFLIGRDGFCFLRGGTNLRVKSKDLVKNEADIAKRWIDLIAAREFSAKSRNINFLQVIIPEKSTVLPQFLPPGEDLPMSLVYENLRSLLRECVKHHRVLDVLEVFHDKKNTEVIPYGKTDTHLTPLGAHKVVCAILDRLGIVLDGCFDDLKFNASVIRSGDIGNAFFMDGEVSEIVERIDELEKIKKRPSSAFYECISIPSSQFLDDLEEGLALISEKSVRPFHIGTTLHWRSIRAPINLKVMIFGNSFFGRGIEEHQVSWWISRLFAECIFIWEPNIDWVKVDEFCPDILIGQTIERFLGVCPEG